MKLFCELLATSGMAAIVYGVHLWSVPSAFVVGGVLSVVVGCVVYPRGEK